MNAKELGITPEKEKVPESLEELQNHFLGLYGRRSNIWLPGRAPRIDLLSIGIGDLQDAIRKERSPVHLGAMFGRVPSRIFGIAQAVNNTSVARAMVEKYPAMGCVYCHSLPCRCSERRPDSDIGWGMSKEQLRWKLGDWQRHLEMLYGDKNRERGVDNVLNRLFKEVAELLNLEREIPKADPNGGMTAEHIEHEFGLELADCLAWTIAAANIIGVDLEAATLERFWPNCWNCAKKPCVCVNFNFTQVNGELTHLRGGN